MNAGAPAFIPSAILQEGKAELWRRGAQRKKGRLTKRRETKK